MTSTGGVTPLTLRPTVRAFGLVLVLGTLVALGLIVGSRGLVPLDVAVAVPLVLSPVLTRGRARRAMSGVHAGALVAPPIVAVGDRSMLEITVVNTSSRPTPVVGMEPPGRPVAETRWHLGPDRF